MEATKRMSDGGPAFPNTQTFDTGDDAFEQTFPGMTLRDYFAAKAMQAIVGEYYADGDRSADNQRVPTVLGAAESAYEFADAMLKAREGKD